MSTAPLILVADDEAMNRDLLRAFLEGAGYRVITAKSGDEAIQLAREHQPALAVFDVHLGGITGFDACRQLKEDATTAPIKIVLYSALDAPPEQARAKAALADGFLSKSLSWRAIVAQLQTYLT